MATISEVLAVALQHQRSGRLDQAEQLYVQILAADPAQADALHLPGVVAFQKAQHERATELIERAVELNGDEAAYHLNLGSVYKARGLLAQAAAAYCRAVQLKPDDAHVHYLHGRLLQEQGAVSDAIIHFERALQHEPRHQAALCALGAVAHEQGRLEDAIVYYRAAVSVKPDDAVVHDDLGSVLLDAGQFDDALDHFRTSLQLKPDYPLAHYHHSLLLLQQGDFERGWPEHEWRWQCSSMSDCAAERPWDGSPLTDKTLLLHADQGYGDMIQFIRYAALVKERTHTVILRCPARMMPLLGRCRGIDQVFSSQEPLPAFDCEAHLTSLPNIFRTKLGTIPRNVPYLFADRSLSEQWAAKLPSAGHRVGIAWQGNPGFQDDNRRSIPLTEFFPLSGLAGVQLISLQKQHGLDQLVPLAGRIHVLRLTGDIDEAVGAFMDTAAIMSNLDLVITSDTSIAHLAGALGVPVWVALPFVPDWRWMLERSDSPWYPTMRLFRQPHPGNWQSVFHDMSSALALL